MHTLRKRTRTAIFYAAAIYFHFVSKRGSGKLFKWQMNTTTAGVAIIFFVVCKSFPGWLILTKVGNITNDIIFFQRFQCFATAVACISKYFFYLYPFLL